MDRRSLKWGIVLASLLIASLLWHADAQADLRLRQAPSGATLIVTSRTDSGAGSLRQALLTARAGDTITFDPSIFPPTNSMTITLLAELPEITQGGLTIDGSNAGVVIDGRYTPGASDGLRIRSDNNTVMGLQIVRFPGDGIELTGGASDNRIGGDWQIGSAPRGQGNIITRNGDEGIDINGSGADSNVIVSNLVGLDADGTEDVRIQAMVISPAFGQDHTLFVGTRYHGVLKSTDGGQHWQPANTGLTVTNILSLAISPTYQADHTLFAGTTSGRIFRSTDGGVNWNASGTGSAWRDISALVVSPAYAADGQVFASTHGQGILGSGDRGITWEFHNEGVSDWVVHDLVVSPNFAVDHLLYAVTGTAAFRSSDGGRTWRATSLPAMRQMYNIVMSPNYAADQTIFLSVDNCNAANMLWKSTDGGDQWTAVGGNPGWCHIEALAISPDYSSEPTLLVGDEWGGIFRSLDGGASWLNVHAAPYATVAAFSPAYTQDRTAFMGFKGGMLLKSADGTSSWYLTSEALSEEGNHNVGIHIREGAQGNIIGGSAVGLRNIVSKNDIDGIVVSGSGSSQNRILGNYIGTDLTGSRPLGNGGSGVIIREQAQDNTIGGDSPGARNVLSGNRMSGVTISSQNTTHNIVTGNYVGVGSDGSTALGNFYSGLKIDTGASHNRIGGTSPAEGNVISGNGENGVTVSEASNNNSIIGNRIGTNANGTSAVPNYYQGVVLGSGAHHNQVGGTTAAERNLISGNGSNGIGIWETGTSFNIVIGNYLGTDASGMIGLGNGESGVLLTNAAENNRVGGETAAERNVIAGNAGAGVALSWSTTISNSVTGNAIGVGADGISQIGNRWGVACWVNAQFNTIRANVIANSAYNGIHLDTCDRNTITGNFIGTNPTGTRDLGNQENGIMLFGAATGNQLGPDNVIAYNRGRGISIWDAGSTGNRITENAIFANRQGGIDLGSGGNADLPTPLITDVRSDFVAGLAPVGGAVVEVFSDHGGQGHIFEGVCTAEADGRFSLSKPAGFTGPYLTVTATDPNGNTSEFSLPLAVSPGAPTPTATRTPSPTTTRTQTMTPAPSSTPPPTPTLTPTAVEGDPYENDDACQQAHPISTDGSVQQHTFHATGDADWVFFDATAGVTYRVEVIPPADSPADVNLELYDSCTGVLAESWFKSFTPSVRLDFTAPASGSLYLRLSNHDALVAGAHVRYELTVRPLLADAPSRALIIAAGRLKGMDGVQTNIHYVADHVHTLFLANGYTEDMIQYLATDASRPGYDAALTRDSLRNSILTWATQRVTGSGVFNLYLVDHGQPDVFFLDEVTGQRLTPDDLADWLDDFEQARPGVRINVFIEACQSGSFIGGTRSISGLGRVIVTSTNASVDAWTLPGAGAYFSDYFLTGLMQGRDIFNSFWAARTAARKAHTPQDAWLDANGNRLANEFEDGVIASGRSFAYADTLSDPWPPHIFGATAQGGVSNYRGSFTAEVRDDEGVALVWAVVYPPGYVSPPAGQQLQAETLPTFLLTPSGPSDIYQGVYTGFTERGLYRIVIYAKDGRGLLARPVEVFVNTGSRVYLPLVVR